MTSRTWRFTAFTTEPTGGNPAGVVVGDTLDDDETMQRVATDIGFWRRPSWRGSPAPRTTPEAARVVAVIVGEPDPAQVT